MYTTVPPVPPMYHPSICLRVVHFLGFFLINFGTFLLVYLCSTRTTHFFEIVNFRRGILGYCYTLFFRLYTVLSVTLIKNHLIAKEGGTGGTVLTLILRFT